MVGLRRNQNSKTDPNLDLSPVEVLNIVNTVAQDTNTDNALHMGKLGNFMAKRTILQRSVILVRAKAKAKALVVQGINHLNTEK